MNVPDEMIVSEFSGLVAHHPRHKGRIREVNCNYRRSPTDIRRRLMKNHGHASGNDIRESHSKAAPIATAISAVGIPLPGADPIPKSSRNGPLSQPRLRPARVRRVETASPLIPNQAKDHARHSPSRLAA